LDPFSVRNPSTLLPFQSGSDVLIAYRVNDKTNVDPYQQTLKIVRIESLGSWKHYISALKYVLAMIDIEGCIPGVIGEVLGLIAAVFVDTVVVQDFPTGGPSTVAENAWRPAADPSG
jgi:hypothetical protein